MQSLRKVHSDTDMFGFTNLFDHFHTNFDHVFSSIFSMHNMMHNMNSRMFNDSFFRDPFFDSPGPSFYHSRHRARPEPGIRVRVWPQQKPAQPPPKPAQRPAPKVVPPEADWTLDDDEIEIMDADDISTTAEEADLPDSSDNDFLSTGSNGEAKPEPEVITLDDSDDEDVIVINE